MHQIRGISVVSGLLMLGFIILHSPALAFAQGNETHARVFSIAASRQIGNQNVPLKGSGTMEYLFLDLYSAAFYTGGSAEEILGDYPKSLVLYYHRGIKKQWMIKAARKCLEKNPDISLDSLEKQLADLSAAYQDIKAGDSYELCYEPDKGTSLYLNGKWQVTIPGEDFQRAYFGIWLSDFPINIPLRDKLLGKSDRER